MANVAVALLFNTMDLLTGFIAALRLKELKSSRLRDGIFKKAGFIMCYILALLIDTYGGAIGFKLDIAILPIVVGYVVLTEIVSILENISRINPDLMPDKLMQLFHIDDLRKGGGQDAGH